METAVVRIAPEHYYWYCCSKLAAERFGGKIESG
jgi:hypothetical protein